MLVRLNVKNFRSFAADREGRTQEFSMLAGRGRGMSEHVAGEGALRVLKFAAVYGANASGKSNLIRALQFLREVLGAGALPVGAGDCYCRADEQNRLRPSYFEVELKLGERCYAYGFEVLLQAGTFLSEWLVELYPDREQPLFERNVAAGSCSFGGEFAQGSLGERLAVYADDVRRDAGTLLLSQLNDHKDELFRRFPAAGCLREVYRWFFDRLRIHLPAGGAGNRYVAEAKDLDRVCELLAAFGTGITGYRTEEVSFETLLHRLPRPLAERTLAELEARRRAAKGSSLVVRSEREYFLLDGGGVEAPRCRAVRFGHGDRSFFRLDEESDGTVRMLDLIDLLLDEDDGRTDVIDELDRCLHPSLTVEYVRTFLRYAKERDNQLIVTTHESRLLDFDLLRRDEIWLIDKRENGESEIYSLEEYDTKFDERVDQAYLDGRFGGVPVFGGRDGSGT